MTDDVTADEFISMIDASRRLLVLTGAGCSTDSGIPDYRDADGQWKHRRPVQFQDFVRHHRVRQRYWARSLLGWPRVDAARPNCAHDALALLERRGRVHHLITQNVDGLHQRAGSKKVIDLHGRLDNVVCLSCDARQSRADLQCKMQELNPRWAGLTAADAPDGDAQLEADFDNFAVPACSRCGGILKPDVVFFGENVPRNRVARAWAALNTADALLVIGSSLMVLSGLRFVRAAAKRDIPRALINLGRTRGDDLFTHRLTRRCAEALGCIAGALDRTGASTGVKVSRAPVRR